MDASPGVRYDYLYVDPSTHFKDPRYYRNDIMLYVD